MTNEEIARLAHEVNRAYCQILGDDSQPPWGEAPDWQKDSALDGVQAHLAGTLSPEQSHQRWMDHKLKDGWRVGPIKDPDHKRHPSLVPYNELPLTERRKDFLFATVIQACNRDD